MTYKGLSKPNLFLNFHTSGVTLGPTIDHRVPGAKCNIKNTISVKPISNGIISNSFIIYCVNLSPQFLTSYLIFKIYSVIVLYHPGMVLKVLYFFSYSYAVIGDINRRPHSLLKKMLLDIVVCQGPFFPSGHSSCFLYKLVCLWIIPS